MLLGKLLSIRKKQQEFSRQAGAVLSQTGGKVN